MLYTLIHVRTLVLDGVAGDGPECDGGREEDDDEGNDEDAEHVEDVVGQLVLSVGREEVECDTLLEPRVVGVTLRVEYDTLYNIACIHVTCV